MLAVCLIALNEELQNPNSPVGAAAKYYLDHPNWNEFMIGNAKPMGHIKDTVPEQPNNMTLKEFMVNHITNYWPGVFRGLAQEWPSYAKW